MMKRNLFLVTGVAAVAVVAFVLGRWSVDPVDTVRESSVLVSTKTPVSAARVERIRQANEPASRSANPDAKSVMQ